MLHAKRNIIVSVIVLLLTIGAVVLWSERRYIQDWLVAQRFTPTSEIAAIAYRTTMSNHGKLLFYASEPEVNEASTFNAQCTRREATAAVLGCYHNGKIYIYQVTNKDLAGVEEVTAAHEMLHAAWERLSEAEQRAIGQELEVVYQRVKTPELEERMEYYERQQPGERDNELHSILGTEQGVLNDRLEQHYRRYFEDRQAIVKLHRKYQSVFTALREKSEKLMKELEALELQLNTDIASYNKSVEELNRAIARHNDTFSSVDRTDINSVNAYNARRTELQAEQATLDQEKKRLDIKRREYNGKIKEYNALAIRSATLTDSIDSFKTQTNIGE